jgi:hypothetical protein
LNIQPGQEISIETTIKFSYDASDLYYGLFIGIFEWPQYVDGVPVGLTKEEATFLVENLQKLLFMNAALYSYLVSDVLYTFSLGSFSMYLESQSSNLDFMEELKKSEANNLENRKLLNLLSQISNLFAKRNNGKGESSVEMLEFCYY